MTHEIMQLYYKDENSEETTKADELCHAQLEALRIEQNLQSFTAFRVQKWQLLDHCKQKTALQTYLATVLIISS